jgi:hypothetical protein
MNDPANQNSGRSGWSRAFLILGLVTFGLSQTAFRLVENNMEWFWGDRILFCWIFLWVQVVPYVAFLLLDILASRLFKRELPFRIWRAILITLVMLSLLRQFEVLHAEYYQRIMRLLPGAGAFAYSVCGALAFFIGVRSRKVLPQYLILVGIFSVLFTLIFVKTTILKPAWNPPQSTVASNKNAPPVFFVVFDELSYEVLLKEGSLDEVSFPHFAELARDSVWFSNATTNHWGTIGAIPAMLTGFATAPPDKPTIFEKLSGQYRVHLVETEMGIEQWLRTGNTRNVSYFGGKASILRNHPLTCGRYVYQLLLDSGFLDPRSSTSHVPFSPAYHLTLAPELADFLGTIRAGQAGGQFSFWHLSLPHSPFMFSASGMRLSGSDQNFDHEPTGFGATWSKYREQTRYADRILGVILERMKQEGLYDRSILVVTSDHGARVWDDLYHHLDLIAHVPLIIHAPGMAAAMSDRDVQHMDLTPTLLQLIGGATLFRSSDFDGVSAFSAEQPSRSKVLHVDTEGLGDVSFTLDPVTHQWNLSKYQPSKDSQNLGLGGTLAAAGTTLQMQSTFSATQVINDLLESKDMNQEFLTIHLQRHFPREVSDSQVSTLRENLVGLQSLPDAPSANFRRGIAYFFLALSETQRLAAGKSENIDQTNQHWKLAIENLRKAKNLEAGLAPELEQVLRKADTDHNGFLNSAELTSIIKTRTQ